MSNADTRWGTLWVYRETMPGQRMKSSRWFSLGLYTANPRPWGHLFVCGLPASRDSLARDCWTQTHVCWVRLMTIFVFKWQTNIHLYIVFIYQMTNVLCIHKRVYIVDSESFTHLDFLVADCQGSICDHQGFDQGISRRVPRGQIRSLRFRV